ncbi:unnamed protein product [Nesidiocoris tenuis]|uniref:Uncharacterized protein n=1 Tax=Nesidiocoris tenuis TaxID=355587 RepID=A0A6H5HE81_9HEMI|nr:unnamed protein product [Nesidiocoris tenuis]
MAESEVSFLALNVRETDARVSPEKRRWDLHIRHLTIRVAGANSVRERPDPDPSRFTLICALQLHSHLGSAITSPSNRLNLRKLGKVSSRSGIQLVILLILVSEVNFGGVMRPKSENRFGTKNGSTARYPANFGSPKSGQVTRITVIRVRRALKFMRNRSRRLRPGRRRQGWDVAVTRRRREGSGCGGGCRAGVLGSVGRQRVQSATGARLSRYPRHVRRRPRSVHHQDRLSSRPPRIRPSRLRIGALAVARLDASGTDRPEFNVMGAVPISELGTYLPSFRPERWRRKTRVSKNTLFAGVERFSSSAETQRADNNSMTTSSSPAARSAPSRRLSSFIADNSSPPGSSRPPSIRRRLHVFVDYLDTETSVIITNMNLLQCLQFSPYLM